MARGKHASSAEARRARESAEVEVVAGRRKIVQLTDRVRELEQQLDAEKRGRLNDVKRLNAMVREGTSAEVDALKHQLRSERQRAADERRARGIEVARLLSISGATVSYQMHGQIAKALGISDGEYVSASNPNRTARRAKSGRFSELRPQGTPAAVIDEMEVRKGGGW